MLNKANILFFTYFACARLAQSVERQPFKLVVVGSSPTVGVFVYYFHVSLSAVIFPVENDVHALPTQRAWARGVAVSRLLRMQKAPGSNPGESIFVLH